MYGFGQTPICPRCNKSVYSAEEITGPEGAWHKRCFRCKICSKPLSTSNFQEKDKEIYCQTCFKKDQSSTIYDKETIKSHDEASGSNQFEIFNNIQNTPVRQTIKQGNSAPSSAEPPKNTAYSPSSIFSRGNAKLNIPKPKDICPRCSKTVYDAEKVVGPNGLWHKHCLKCKNCNTSLESGKVTDRGGEAYCTSCYNKLWGPKSFIAANSPPETQRAANTFNSRLFASNSANLVNNTPTVSNPYNMSPTRQSVSANNNVGGWPNTSPEAHLLSSDTHYDNITEHSVAHSQNVSPFTTEHNTQDSTLSSYSTSSDFCHDSARNTATEQSYTRQPESLPYSTVSRNSDSFIQSPNKVASQYYRRATYTPKAPIFTIQADICPRCQKRIYAAEMATFAGKKFHKSCVTCYNCRKSINTSNMADREGEIYCSMCYGRLFGPKGAKIRHGETYSLN